MPDMTTAASRITLLPAAARPSGPHAAKVRRYRLARVRLAERRDAGPPRHPQLARTYD